MKRALLLAAFSLLASGAGADSNSFRIPTFPAPRLVQNQFGEAKQIGFLSFQRQLMDGGVTELDDLDIVDESYAVLRSDSLPGLAAWLEAACRSVGVELSKARQAPYDGMVYARLLEVVASLAAIRKDAPALAMPIGVLICQRQHPWGELPGDGARDAYVLVATEQGMLIYDPPTRQLSPLSDFPNSSAVSKIQF